MSNALGRLATKTRDGLGLFIPALVPGTESIAQTLFTEEQDLDETQVFREEDSQ